MSIPLARNEVFEFFSYAGNLQKITPPELNFKIITPLPILMNAGTIIEYQLNLFLVKVNWLTKITKFEPPDFFVDEQLKGPYKTWIHTHRFFEESGITVIEDSVDYELPVQPLGEIVLPLVKFQLNRIFSYRKKMVKTLLVGKSSL